MEMEQQCAGGGFEVQGVAADQFLAFDADMMGGSGVGDPSIESPPLLRRHDSLDRLPSDQYVPRSGRTVELCLQQATRMARLTPLTTRTATTEPLPAAMARNSASRAQNHHQMQRTYDELAPPPQYAPQQYAPQRHRSPRSCSPPRFSEYRTGLWRERIDREASLDRVALEAGLYQREVDFRAEYALLGRPNRQAGQLSRSLEPLPSGEGEAVPARLGRFARELREAVEQVHALLGRPNRQAGQLSR
ncbi:hypothetical protein LTR08_003655 [Meristemomyces frigidus]|nr:hypothetical protein LTR08_003655 [Meristemomyces frigidus]